VKRREFISLLGGVFVFLCVSAAAQEGHNGAGHEKWHQGSSRNSKEMMSEAHAVI
jgi:hypothetical protein